MLEDIYLTGSNLLLEKLPDEETAAGIILPSSARTLGEGTPFTRGIVKKVGPGKICQDGTRSALLSKVGDEVAIFGTDAFTIVIDGHQFIVTSEEMIIFGRHRNLGPARATGGTASEVVGIGAKHFSQFTDKEIELFRKRLDRTPPQSQIWGLEIGNSGQLFPDPNSVARNDSDISQNLGDSFKSEL